LASREGFEILWIKEEYEEPVTAYLISSKRRGRGSEMDKFAKQFLLFLEPCHDVQLAFVFAHLRIYQNLSHDISKSLSKQHHHYILLAMIIHNQQGLCTDL